MKSGKKRKDSGHEAWSFTRFECQPSEFCADQGGGGARSNSWLKLARTASLMTRILADYLPIITERRAAHDSRES
jgi:hypothetical protein